MLRKMAFLLALAVIVIGAFFAGRATLTSQPVITNSNEKESVITVSTQTIGRSITLSTTVERHSQPIAVNHLAGVVTALPASNKAELGKPLYTVGGRPVMALLGKIPFYRDLGPDTTGDDVRQVQESLSKLGFALRATGSWNDATSSALSRWQKQQGLPSTGVLNLGEAIAFPTLPATVVLDNELLWAGNELRGGEVVLRTYAGTPSFSMTLTPSQAELVPAGTEVRVHSGEQVWKGVTGEPKQADGKISVPITSPTGGLVCTDACSQLPVQSNLSLLTEVLVVPAATGPVVPVSAIQTSPEGTTSVTVMKSGAEAQQQVAVQQIADGLAVVEGVENGTTVKVFSKP